MSSPHMYDPAYPAAAAADEALKGGGGKLPHIKQRGGTLDLCEGSVPDLSDLNAPELSFDLQNYIGPDSGHPVVSLDDSSSLFTDILAEHQHKPRFAPQYRYPMPQQGQINSDHYGTDASGLVIKREPVDHIDLSSCSQRAGYTNGGSIYSYPPITDRQGGGLGGYLPGLGRLPGGKPALPKASSSSSSSSSSSKHKKNVDKSSDEYRRRRERNNIAVRKSREKAKIRTRETERKVSELVRENDYLRKKVEMLTKELNVLKTVMSNVGVPPESVDSEIVKSMHMDYGMHQEL